MTCCRPSGSSRSTPATSWATRACSCRCPTRTGSASPRPTSRSGSAWRSAIGSAIARPDRLTVAALGDGGALMGVSELETAVRLGLPMVIVVYDDEAYGAEVHHFGPDGYPLDTVRFPPADLAAIGRGLRLRGRDRPRAGATWARCATGWTARGDTPLVIDAKVTARSRLLVAGGGLPRPLSKRPLAAAASPVSTPGWPPLAVIRGRMSLLSGDSDDPGQPGCPPATAGGPGWPASRAGACPRLPTRSGPCPIRAPSRCWPCRAARPGGGRAGHGRRQLRLLLGVGHLAVHGEVAALQLGVRHPQRREELDDAQDARRCTTASQTMTVSAAPAWISSCLGWP